ncbi:glycosyltransferase [Candidatus Finniella inopinata]|nr:glycosyltransferase [Candidatus Finniella inopinata]
MGLKNYFDHEVAQSKFGRASDSLRYAILYKYGGIYRDIDFLMTRPFTGLALAYDFFAGIEYPYCFPCNAMFGCRAAHPVLKKALEIVARNYDPKRAPAYVQDAFKYPGKHGGELLHTLSLTGPIAFGVALKKAFLDMGPTEFGLPIDEQLDGRKDRNILLPPEAFYWTQGMGKEPSSFGWHAFSGTWFNPAFGSNG